MRVRTAAGLAAAISLGIFASPGRVRAEGPLLATFTQVQGEVRVSTSAGGSAPAARWRPAEKGMRVGPGATIRTGLRGYAELLFDDATALRLEKNTRLTLRQAERKKGVREFFVEMFNGRLLSDIPKLNKFGKSKFDIKTPACTASVRGTQFVTEASSAAATVAVYEGSVAAENPSAPGEVEVAALRQTEIAGDRPPAAPHPLSAEMERYQKDVAALFAQYADGLRSNMEAVREMNRIYMERHRLEFQEGMDDFNDSVQDVMEEFRKQVNPEGE